MNILDYVKTLEAFEGQPIQNPEEYMNGFRDCEEGNKFKQGQGRDYERGYSYAYQRAEMMSRWEE